MVQKRKQTLENITHNKPSVICSVNCPDHKLRSKLFNMGFIPGETVEVIRSAPLLDPMEVKLLGYHVVLRKDEACMIEVEYDD